MASGTRVRGGGSHDEAVNAVEAMKGTVNGIGPFILSEGNTELVVCQGTPVPIVLIGDLLVAEILESSPTPDGGEIL